LGGWSPLLRAAQRGYDAIVVQLLEAHAALEATTARDGLRAVHLAGRDGHAAVVRHLLVAGADAGAADRHGKTALFYACTSGQEAIARSLLRAGASVNATSSGGMSPLHAASTGGHVGVISLLLQAQALAEATTSDGSTALSHAVDAAEPGAVRRLLEGRRRPLGEEEGAAGLLHTAAAGISGDAGEAAAALTKKKTEVFELLLDARCDINVPRASDGRTVLMVAAQSGKAAPLVELLISHGADPNRSAVPASPVTAAARETGPLQGLVVADGVWGATTEFATVGARDALVCAGSAAYFEVAAG
jgi:ankyrin repeat protein